MLEEFRICRRLLHKYIQCRTSDFSRLQSPQQGLFINNSAPGTINDAYARLAGADLIVTNESACFVVQRSVHCNDICLCIELIKGNELNAQFCRNVIGKNWIESNGLHPKRLTPNCDFPADLAKADDSQCLPKEFHPDVFLSIPFSLSKRIERNTSGWNSLGR